MKQQCLSGMEFDLHADIYNVGSGSLSNDCIEVQALKAKTQDQTGLVICIEV